MSREADLEDSRIILLDEATRALNTEAEQDIEVASFDQAIGETHFSDHRSPSLDNLWSRSDCRLACR